LSGDLLSQGRLGLKVEHRQVRDRFGEVERKYAGIRSDVVKHIAWPKHALAAVHEIGIPTSDSVKDGRIDVKIIVVDRQHAATPPRFDKQ
jgi:hypothetical protein